MPLHLMLDLLAGVLLSVSPWLFHFADHGWWVHVVAGFLILSLSLTTWRTAAFSEEGVPADGWLY